MTKSKKKRIPSVKKWSFITLLVTFIFFIWYVASDRITPNTDQARVKGLILPVAPMVNGYVTKVNVGLHSEVKQGDTLFVINQTPYKIAVDIAESDLEKVLQSISAGESSIKAATARLSKAKVSLDRATKNWKRTQRVIAQNKGALSERDKDFSEASYLGAIEQVASAKAGLDKELAALGPTDGNNPNIKSVLSRLEKAQWELANTVIMAPSDGIIESFNVEVGYFAGAGKSMVTLVSNNTMWIQANLKENNISNISLGDEADLIFDIAPGKVYKGKVSSIAYGVSTDKTNVGDLPTVSGVQGWLRDPQRFPVILEIEDTEIMHKLRQGSQVEVVVYTGNNWLLNFLASVRIHIMSILSYVR
ncbi:HlyD family secretion protein [Gaetbulibacter saemankumensis]|uniref:HlyD family secretion protein n=1 Tax=Gaetbulibacter saemankumensis TaxID=311208 RepID=UPI000685A567|nr:HlyD family secretion protein [Gaetbulibacter saemankumensis]